MIEILEAPDQVFACRMIGTLDGDDYDRMVAAIEAKLAAHPKIGVSVDMTGFTDLTGEALLKDLRYNFTKLGQWGRFPRLAMVTDKQWLAGLVRLLDPVFPQFEAEIFQPGQEAAAIAWVADLRS